MIYLNTMDTNHSHQKQQSNIFLRGIFKFLFPTFNIIKQQYWLCTIPACIMISLLLGIFLGFLYLLFF